MQVYSENVNRGGGGMNCITQQQPASATFARRCGWAKVQVDAQVATLYAASIGQHALGTVPRLTRIRRGHLPAEALVVREAGAGPGRRAHPRLHGEVGWVDEEDIESAGEKRPAVYSRN